jgi:TIR domain
MEPIRQMCSYSHEDRRLMMRLHQHFEVLRREKLMVHWWDREIGPGSEWRGVVDEHLNTAQIILLLVSPSFMASDYCYDVEVKRAMERHDRGECKVIPVILRPCFWNVAPFGRLQALPEGAKPVTTWRPQDLGYRSVVDAVQAILLSMRNAYA